MAKILVVGDCMLDRYWYGDVTRLSQEAPVPVVRKMREECRAGAAANVAMNCASLGGDVKLLGVTGLDQSANDLHAILDRHGIKRCLLTDSKIDTTQKLRIIGRNQQIVRVDIEGRSTVDYSRFAWEDVLAHDIIVFSDYGKGALSNVAEFIRFAKREDKVVLVDPKGYDYSKYAGADLVKPNLDEIREMTGGWGSEEQLADKVAKIRRDADIGAVLLTRAADGMTLYDDSGTHHIPTVARDVYDVTGAGDTCMAGVAVALSHGKALLEACQFANCAAGIVCGKFGTSTVTMQEIMEEMNAN